MILAVLLMILIFKMSGIPIKNSNQMSQNIAISIFKFLNISIENNNLLNKFNYIIRKSSHFFSYMILAIILYLHFSKQNISSNKIINYVAILLILFAISDEIHQTYVPGRMGKFTDILIDSSGVILGIIIMNKKNNNLVIKKDNL